MSPTLAPPPSPTGTSRRRREWLSADSDKRSVQIGILGTILIHLLLLILAPQIFKMDKTHPIARRPTPRPFNIDISPDSFLPSKPPPKPLPPKFVETNPNAPENIPDKTANISNRNQQVAQEKPTPNGKSDHPALEGRKDFQSTQIVSGQLAKPQESTPVDQPLIKPPTKPTIATPPHQAQNPLAGFEKQTGNDKDGFASNVAKEEDDARAIPNKIDGTKDAPVIDNPTPFSPPTIDPRHPQPRHTLASRVRPAIFSDNKIGTSNIGPVAIDARWSNYGVYLQRMIETVQIEWDHILAVSKVRPNSGSIVAVKFVMDKTGAVKIAGVDPSAGTSDEATRACVSAITQRSPYGDWSDDMIAVLGKEQEMTFSFYYQ